MVIRRIAVVGASIAGLACANRLVACGHEVKVYDKGRGVGGRAATRRIRVGESDLRFDPGAQFFTARDPAFRSLVDRLVSAGAIAIYPNTVTSITTNERALLPDEPRFVGTPGMSGMAKALAEGAGHRDFVPGDGMYQGGRGMEARSFNRSQDEPF